jgi:uncharacterized LabA/DUF88 family protein
VDHPREVGLFIDFENIRYSVLNTYHRELTGSMLIDLGRRYGRVTLARAYADFNEHPERVQRDLQVAGIQAVASTTHQVGDRPKGGADIEMLADLFETLLDRPNLGTYMLMTGDRRFIRMVTLLRNRGEKEVVISGVRGSVSNDLIEAAGGRFEPLEFPPIADVDRRETFVRFVDRLERSKPYITFKYVAAAMSTSSEFPGLGEDEAREFVAESIQGGILLKHQRQDGYRVLHLNRDHDETQGVLSRPGPVPDRYPEDDYDGDFYDDEDPDTDEPYDDRESDDGDSRLDDAITASEEGDHPGPEGEDWRR